MGRDKSGLRNLVLISKLGIHVMTPIFLCLAAGVWIDGRFGTSLTIPLMILGVLSGALSAYRLAKQSVDREREELEKEKKKKKEEWESRYGTDGGDGHRKRRDRWAE